MLLIIVHVIIALSSLVLTALAYFFPSKSKLYMAYTFVALTILTGTYLVWSKPSHLMQSCVMGLVYLGIISFAIFLARNKLAKNKS